jgi:predicted aspartyl protease
VFNSVGGKSQDFRLWKGVRGPALVDTGFDGGIYANLTVASFLEGNKPVAEEVVEASGHSIRCELFKVSCRLVDGKGSGVEIGEVEVHVPTEPMDLSGDVLVGRMLLNRLQVSLNGKRLSVGVET